MAMGKSAGVVCRVCGDYGRASDSARVEMMAAGEMPTKWWHCQCCGAHMERWRGQGDQSCDRCGAQYNAGGQRLRDDWAPLPLGYDEAELGDMEEYELASLMRDGAR